MQRRDGFAALLALPFVSALPVRAAEAKRRITVYTAVEPEWLAVYRNAFAAVRPDIEITYVRASGGPICARLLAEKDRVQADAVLGVSAIALENLRAKGILEPYAPHEVEKLNPKMVERITIGSGSTLGEDRSASIRIFSGKRTFGAAQLVRFAAI